MNTPTQVTGTRVRVYGDKVVVALEQGPNDQSYTFDKATALDLSKQLDRESNKIKAGERLPV